MALTYYDFFAGGGMAGKGLGSGWKCLFANDIDPMKAQIYRENHDGGSELLEASVSRVSLADLPGRPDLAWASFPCQDLSLAGKGAGLAGERSGMFVPFWKLMEGLASEGRGARIIAIENVRGAITSRKGEDFATLAEAFSDLGYRFGAMIIDAAHFLPQSRPRFFMVGVHPDVVDLVGLSRGFPDYAWHPQALVKAHDRLSPQVKANWIWWNLPPPRARNTALLDLIEDQPTGVQWHSQDQTAHLLGMMTSKNLAKIELAKRQGGHVVGTIYRRTRPDGDGIKRQRAEVRFDNIAGCLRTPGGGSSRQTIIIVENGQVKTRLLSPREAAALMGLDENYVLPDRYNDAYKLAGDGVAVPVVRYLASSLLEPILFKNSLDLAA